MKKQSLTSDEIYRIGDKVFNAVRLPDEKVDEILGDSGLFNRIRTATESARRDDTRISFNGSSGSNGWTWQTGLASFATLAVIVAGALGIINLAKAYYLSPEVTVHVPDGIASDDVPQLPPPSTFESQGPVTELVRPGRRNAKVGSSKSTRMVKSPASTENEESGEFQELVYGDDAEGFDESGQVVRVELPRSTLFAMGVAVQVENQNNDSIAADLLLGEDGMTKAVRIIDK